MDSSLAATTPLAHARSLLAAIHDAPAVVFPRREIIVAWLEDYLARARHKGYLVDDAETKDLTALERFLRRNQIAVSGVPAA
jgi:hypothetical protein